MTATDPIDRLAAHKTVGGAPREELAWLVAHGSLRELETGQILTPKGGPVEGLFIVISGRVAMFVDRGAGKHKIMEVREGDVTGLLPYSRLVGPPGDSVAQEPTVVLAVHRDRLPEMIRECYHVTSILVHKMVDRARLFTSSDLHDEKMVSLGKLSAGLAHELNNPTSAIERGAALLGDRLEDFERAARALGASTLTDAQAAAIETARTRCLMAVPGVFSPIQQAEREEAIVDWIARRHLDKAIAEPLAETAVTPDALETLASAVEGPALEAGLRWLATGCSVRGLTSDIQGAAMRISGLVTAVKGFTHMDQVSIAEPVDLPRGLSDTITVLKAKARSKSVAVAVKVEDGLPLVHGFMGELNQIWANLLDNALDAVADGGRVEITANRQGQQVVVRVIDNGPGIPDEIRQHLFEPFFTTKPVGKGTGLGLDIVRRLVSHNNAEIAVESGPGRTEFRVALPIAQTAPVAHS